MADWTPPEVSQDWVPPEVATQQPQQSKQPPISIGQAVLGARSGMQSESMEAREFLRTAPGQVRGTGDQPVIPIPRIPQQRSVLGQLGAGTVNIGSALAEMTETPQLIAAAPVLPARLTQLLFGGQALSDIRSAYEEARQPGTTIQQGLELGGRALVDALFGVGMVRGAVGDRLAPRTAAEARTSAAGLERITPDQGGEINAIKTREIQKGIQPERIGTAQGENVPAYAPQVREAGGEQAGRGDSLRAAAQTQEVAPVPQPEQPVFSPTAEIPKGATGLGPAVQMEDGKVFTGPNHALALDKAIQSGYSPDNAETGYAMTAPVSTEGQGAAVAGQPRIISTAINTPEGIKRGTKWNQPHDEIGAASVETARPSPTQETVVAPPETVVLNAGMQGNRNALRAIRQKVFGDDYAAKSANKDLTLSEAEDLRSRMLGNKRRSKVTNQQIQDIEKWITPYRPDFAAPVPEGGTRAIGGAAAQQGIPEEQKGFLIQNPDGTTREVWGTEGRKEAAIIAKAAGQVKPENADTTALHSQQLQEAPETAAAVPPTVERPVPRKVSPEVFNTAVNALRSMKESKGTATDRVNAAIRDLSQSGEEVNLNNVLRRALQRNVPQVIEVGSPREIGVSELEGRAMGAAGTAEIPIRGWKDMIDAGEQPALHPTAERAATQFIGKVLDTVGRGFRNTRDFLTVQPVPKLTRVGLADAAYEHASARNYVVHSVRHLLSRVFPDEYKNPELMRKTGDILTKDNILGVYDQAKTRFEATRNAQAPIDVAEHNASGKAMKAIESAHDLAAYDRDVQAARADPKISANIDRWKQWVNPEMDRMYNEIKGYDPWTIQESRGRHFEARINLLPKDQAERIASFTDATKPMPEMPTSNYRNPNVKRDPFMRQAKGTGQYETDPGLILTNSIARRWNEITKIRLYEAVQKTGNGFITEPGERPPMTEIDGEPLARMAVKMPETTEKGLTRSVEKSLWIKKSLVRETRDVLNTDLAAPSNPVFRALTQLQLLQAVDMTAHMKNIHTVVANSLGASRGWVDAVRKMPVLATADTVGRIAAVTKEVLADTPAIRDEISQMARQGMIRPAYPPSGIQKITRGQQMIHSVDTASRIVMNRFWDNLAERGMVNDTMQARRAFVNQIGEYNRRLMGHFSRNMRDYGLSPFVVAGRTFNRFSKRLLLGDPGFKAATPQAALAARAYQLGGLTLAVTLPAIINYITTGHFGGRPGTPIGAIDTGTNNAKGDKRIIDILQLMGIRRGLRGTGVGAIIEGVREGKTVNEIGGKMIEDITSTASHPWIGPGLGAVYSGLTGKRLDLRGGSWPYIAKQKKEGGIEQYKENFRVTLKNQNPLIYGLIAPLIGETDDTYMQGLGRGFLKAPVSALGVQEKPGSSAFSSKRERTKNREAAPRPRKTKQ